MTKNNSNTVQNKNVDEKDKNYLSILEHSQAIQKFVEGFSDSVTKLITHKNQVDQDYQQHEG